ncbi:uncharacterized protein il17rc isoform X2 [Pungitius pungitius]|uniref:uncharacterized protein il17rc isoform X2 n=1 Tax=Pungitius pungitius TaxID=134920 RepID=UPI002E11BF85
MCLDGLGVKSFGGKMFLPGWSSWCVLLTLHIHGALATSGYTSHEVFCLQGLSNCTIEDKMLPALPAQEKNGVAVRNLNPYFKLCCRDGGPCAVCLVIDAEIDFKPDNDTQQDDHSGYDEEDYSEEAESNPRASVKLCYQAVHVLPTCKKVQFVVNHGPLTQKDRPKFTVVIREPAGVSFSTHVTVFSAKPAALTREVDAPSLDEVCSQQQQERVEQCAVPRLLSVINQAMNRVELKLADTNESLPSVCVQYEADGDCRDWDRRPIPLDSVTPCTCLQVWKEDKLRRSQSCPFVHTDVLQRNVRDNVSVSMSLGQAKYLNHSMLWWNLTAPCRLEGEVWLCNNEHTCRQMEGFKQQLANNTWKQNSKGQWVKLKGMGALPLFCLENTDRWRWSLLVVGLMLLVCVTVLAFYFLHDAVKEWVWSCRHGGFVKISSEGHVVLLSPPDVDHSVSESVCELGAQLRNRGFNVLVDQCSRKEQCSLGPLPWLHSQLMEMNSRGGTFVLVLTRAALSRAEGWAHPGKEVIKAKGDPTGLPEITSPYSDVFSASLSLIQADKQLGRAGERFLLVTLGLHPKGDRRLPELLRGLPLFQLPSQTKALLHELTVGRTRRTWTGWEWTTSGRRTAKTSQRASYSKSAEDA